MQIKISKHGSSKVKFIPFFFRIDLARYHISLGRWGQSSSRSPLKYRNGQRNGSRYAIIIIILLAIILLLPVSDLLHLIKELPVTFSNTLYTALKLLTSLNVCLHRSKKTLRKLPHHKIKCTSRLLIWYSLIFEPLPFKKSSIGPLMTKPIPLMTSRPFYKFKTCMYYIQVLWCPSLPRCPSLPPHPPPPALQDSMGSLLTYWRRASDSFYCNGDSWTSAIPLGVNESSIKRCVQPQVLRSGLRHKGTHCYPGTPPRPQTVFQKYSTS